MISCTYHVIVLQTYQSPSGVTCCKCPAGHRVMSHCTELLTSPQCVPCDDHHFADASNGNNHCTLCHTSCPKNGIEVSLFIIRSCLFHNNVRSVTIFFLLMYLMTELCVTTRLASVFTNLGIKDCLSASQFGIFQHAT